MFDELPTLPWLQGGQVVHRVKDDYGQVLVIDDDDQRILTFDSLFEQSCMQLSHPHQLVHKYTRFMALALAFADPDEITFFGLGGGSLLRALHHALPDCSFHAIELRQAVVDVASEYFSLPQDQRVSITVGDAFRQVREMNSNSSDIIFSDMYDAYRMAPGQIQKRFLQECARVLTQQGFLVINLHSLPGGQSAFFEMLLEIFPTVMSGATAENVVLYVSKADPEQVEPVTARIENLEAHLRQRLKPLLSRVQPA